MAQYQATFNGPASSMLAFDAIQSWQNRDRISQDQQRIDLAKQQEAFDEFDKNRNFAVDARSKELLQAQAVQDIQKNEMMLGVLRRGIMASYESESIVGGAQKGKQAIETPTVAAEINKGGQVVATLGLPGTNGQPGISVGTGKGTGGGYIKSRNAAISISDGNISEFGLADVGKTNKSVVAVNSRKADTKKAGAGLASSEEWLLKTDQANKDRKASRIAELDAAIKKGGK